MKTILLLLLVSFSAQAKDYEIFDGRFYNGLFYPLVDNIEWGEADGELPHMEFHIHQKDKQIELTAVPGEKNGHKVLWLVYDMKFRGERVCRYVVAPSHFKEGMKVYAYRDNSDPDYDNIYVYSFPVKAKNLVEYKMPDYAPCSDEFASNKPDTGGRVPASVGGGVNEGSKAPGGGSSAAPSSVNEGSTSAVGAPAAAPRKAGPDYDNSAVPFSF